MAEEVRTGRCNCGRVTLRALGNPKRVGLCYCMTCRRETGSLFLAYAVWPRERVDTVGEVQSWRESRADRFFCPHCGSRMFNTEAASDEIEVRLGILDEAPSSLQPDHECWTVRREPWLQPIAGAKQFLRERTEK